MTRCRQKEWNNLLEHCFHVESTYDAHTHHRYAVVMQLVLEQGEIVVEHDVLPLHQLELVECLIRALGPHLVVHSALVGGCKRPVKGLELLLHGLLGTEINHL